MTTPILVITLIGGWYVLYIGYSLCLVTSLLFRTFPIMMNVIGTAVIGKYLNRGPYYGVAGAWCFITNAYDRERALLHYGPVRYLSGRDE